MRGYGKRNKGIPANLLKILVTRRNQQRVDYKSDEQGYRLIMEIVT